MVRFDSWVDNNVYQYVANEKNTSVVWKKFAGVIRKEECIKKNFSFEEVDVSGWYSNFTSLEYCTGYDELVG